MLARTLEVIGSVWLAAALGTGLALLGIGLGWNAAESRSLPPVRLVAWWVRRVVTPLLGCRKWWRRVATIFINNTTILVIVAALGKWHVGALVGVACVGISLGIGLRVLSTESAPTLEHAFPVASRKKWPLRIGIALNLLEPPAIALTLGLSLGRQSVPLSATQVWETFALCVVPLSLVAAGGEALWLGATQSDQATVDSSASESNDP